MKWSDIRDDGFQENGEERVGVLRNSNYEKDQDFEWFQNLKLNQDELKTIRQFREEHLLESLDNENEEEDNEAENELEEWLN